MTFEEIKALDEQYVMHSYGRFQVAIDHGKGATVWAVDGKEYIDFSAGIGVCSLGYGDPGWVEAVSTQAAKLGHISNLFYTEPYAKVAQKLCVRTGMSNVMFGNSGAEANEAMIKLARKYSFDRYGKAAERSLPSVTPSTDARSRLWRPRGRISSTTTFSPSPRGSAMPMPTTWIAWKRWPAMTCAPS